jgi:hypothetical protein
MPAHESRRPWCNAGSSTLLAGFGAGRATLHLLTTFLVAPRPASTADIGKPTSLATVDVPSSIGFTGEGPPAEETLPEYTARGEQGNISTASVPGVAGLEVGGGEHPLLEAARHFGRLGLGVEALHQGLSTRPEAVDSLLDELLRWPEAAIPLGVTGWSCSHVECEPGSAEMAAPLDASEQLMTDGGANRQTWQGVLLMMDDRGRHTSWRASDETVEVLPTVHGGGRSGI